MDDILALAKLVCVNWDSGNLADTVRELSNAITRYENDPDRPCDLLHDLVRWADYMGGFESEVWCRAGRAVGRSTE